MLRILLFPFALLYGLVTGIRNWLFDWGVLRSEAVDVPTVCIGNLTVGGTGKTPHTEYVLDALRRHFRTAVLSRGYKRHTRGFVLAGAGTDALQIGDEPYQMSRKYPDVCLAVDERRVHGVRELLSRRPDLDVVVLDDALQHRAIRPGLTVLLTDYARLYTRDWPLPAGRLREWRSGSRRANIIIVSKCPVDLPADEMQRIRREIAPREGQSLYFSTYRYRPLQAVFPEACPAAQPLPDGDTGILLVAGIVSPQAMVSYLAPQAARVETMFFPDHHLFTAQDFEAMRQRLRAMNFSRKMIVVTEKDAARLLSVGYYPETLKPLTYALPIEVRFLDDPNHSFIQKITRYVTENSRNGRLPAAAHADAAQNRHHPGNGTGQPGDRTDGQDGNCV